jgi:orotidine-5'-phosphate decarboxylase
LNAGDLTAQPEIIVALDVNSLSAAEDVMARMPDELRWYKVGLELYTAVGPDILRLLHRNYGKRIFLDLKLHDIPNTVAAAVRAAAGHGIGLLTVHASGGQAMLAAAANAATGLDRDAPRLLAVTALTSLADADLHDIGVQRTVSEQVLALGQLACDNGIDGLVSSAWELAALRRQLGRKPILVTPGIRLPGGEVGDQKRVATPSTAAQAGANFLVVGRPLLTAKDPHEVLARLKADMQETSAA